MGSITSANALYFLAVANVYAAPQQLQQFAADDIFTSDDIPTAEVAMGVDGKLAAGFVNAPVVQSVALMADSVSNIIFDDWARYMKTNQDVAFAQGTVILPSLNKKWTLVNGMLTRYKPIADATRTMQSRRFQLVWEAVVPANI